uniref:Cadherin domain-containing protein n=1 Tax=Rhabditophanes sp. KR3021 TaxID=114890 RepID=A0AC35UA46_9BILA
MMNQFLFSVMDEDGIDANTVELGGSAGKHFILQKVPDDDLYQIVLIESPRSGKSELEIIVKSVDPLGKKLTKSVPVKALVCLNINSDIIVRQNEIDNYSQLIFDKTKNFGTYQINTTLFENASPGKVLANLLSFNPLNGEQPKECKINGDLAEYFEVNLSNGDLILSKAIDYEALTNKNINIEILCQENKMNNVVVLMEIQVFGVNDNKPIITVETENDSNSFTISENLQPLTVIFNFTIADNDMDDDFSIAIIGKGNSKFVTEKIGEKMYAFKSGPGSKFDFEKEKQYNLLMVVKDKAHNLKKYAFTVNFIDQNDNPPIMRNNYFEFKVVENWPEDVFVGSVIADDADEESSLKSMNFSISIQHGDFFKIDNKSGKIYTAKKLKKIDKELPYEMKITVTDSLNANFKNYSIVTMKIVEPDSIIRTEKRHLQFSKPQNGEIIKIDEKTEAFSVIYEVKMEFNVGVKDSSYEILEYDITDLENKSDSTFSIDKGTGMLRLNQPLDYEKKSKYSISISVSGINVEEEDRIRKEKNGKSSICFHISENGIIKPVDEYVEFLQTLFAKYARLSDVYEDYGVRNIMNCNKPWSPHSKKGFSGSVQIREDTSIQAKIIVTISLIFVYVLFFLILYNCILIRYRNNLQLKKKAIKVTMDQKICALNATNFKQLAISSPQFAIGYNPNLMEY